MTSADRNPGDVRMRGFTGRALVETARAWVDAHSAVLGSETIELGEAQGRILSEDLLATFDVPQFDRAAMDGYALRGSETDGAGDYNPLSLSIIGEALPGQPYEGDVPPGSAVRIMTGAPVPRGTDAVLPAEFARELTGKVEALAAVPPGKNVGRRSEDVRAGETVLSSGRKLRPQDLGVLASLGIAKVSVCRRPRVRIVITGDELVPPGQPIGPYQIYEANSAMLRSLVARDGGTLESCRRVRDQREEIRAAIIAAGADVILVSGGSSVGAEDHAPSIVAGEGTLAIHGIAMRPSSPAGMGKIGSSLVFLLPGNPVSCLCAYDFFAGRAIRRLGGRRVEWPYPQITLSAGRKIVSAVGRLDYCRVRIVDGLVEPLALSGASILSSTTRADGFVVIPEECEGYAPGTPVVVYRYDQGE
ncbi:MAG: gephyrin-like molybdotransferase Glp [Planctomycetaceae bacterium]